MSIATDPAPAGTTGLPCSDETRAAGDDPTGSGTEFSTFLLLDYRLPWARDTAGDAVRDLLTPRAAAAVHARESLRAFGIRPVTDRRRTIDVPARAGRVGPGAVLAELPQLPDEQAVTSIADGRIPGERSDGILIGVCTNARRDRCCAVRGRKVATDLQARFGDQISEISHLGGHRFAATLLVFPSGYSYGFLDPASAHTVVSAAMDGLVHPAGLRGRADLDGAAQTADAHWRRGIGPASMEAVQITSVVHDDAGDLVEARVQDTVDRVRVRRVPGPAITVTACGGKPIPTGRWEITPA